ncbi:MAG: hypothetical protein Q4D54_10900, partial [Eubacteriales bacterium]|nr:hypothetical protein [Eubacteriales bacterium]
MKNDEIPLISNTYISPSEEENPVSDDNPEEKKQTTHESANKVIFNIICTAEAYFIILFLWLEIVFHFARFGATIENLLIKICYAFFFGSVFGTIFGLIPKCAGKIVTGIVAFITTLYYIVQIVYSGVFATYLSVTGSIGMTGQAFDFLEVIKRELVKEWWIIVLLLLPFVGYCAYLCRKIQRPIVSLKRYGCQILAIVLCYLVSYGCMRLNRKGDYTAYEIYKSYTSVDLAVKKLGVCESFYVDVRTYAEDKFHIGKHDVVFVEEEMQNNTTGQSAIETDKLTTATEEVTTA